MMWSMKLLCMRILSNLLVDRRKLTVSIKIKELLDIIDLDLPRRGVCEDWLWHFQQAIIYFFCFSLKTASLNWKVRCNGGERSLQSHRGLKESSKLYLNLWYCNWLLVEAKSSKQLYTFGIMTVTSTVGWWSYKF